MKYIELFNGHKIPPIGLGLWQVDDVSVFENTVDTALEIGYRHFDIAYNYKNEAHLGNVLQKWFNAGKIKREDLFITTKLPMIGMNPTLVEHFVNLSLKALQLDYVDLYIPHFPVGFVYVNDTDTVPKDKEGNVMIDNNTDTIGIWRAMEAQVEAGRIRSIGLSNYNAKQIERIMKIAKIQPANLQVELNAYLQQPQLLEVCRKYNISVVGYGNLGSPGRVAYFKKSGRAQEFVCPSILDDPVVLGLSEKYKRTNAQILLRFMVQLGVIPIPKTSNPARLKNNFEIFDFELDEEAMTALKGLDRGEAGRTFSMRFFPGAEDHPEYPFLDEINDPANEQS